MKNKGFTKSDNEEKKKKIDLRQSEKSVKGQYTSRKESLKHKNIKYKDKSSPIKCKNKRKQKLSLTLQSRTKNGGIIFVKWLLKNSVYSLYITIKGNKLKKKNQISV